MPLLDMIAQGGPSDKNPDAFSFTCCTGVNPATASDSNSVTPTGYDATSPVNISAGYYCVSNLGWANSAGTIKPGCSVRVCLTSNSSYTGGCCSVLCVGTLPVCAGWCLVTRAMDCTPDSVCACCYSNIEINAVCCNNQTITGIDCVSVNSSGASQISVNGGGFSTGTCCICNNQCLCIKLTGPSTYSTTCTGYVCVGTCTATGGITTCADPNRYSVLIQCPSCYTCGTCYICGKFVLNDGSEAFCVPICSNSCIFVSCGVYFANCWWISSMYLWGGNWKNFLYTSSTGASGSWSLAYCGDCGVNAMLPLYINLQLTEQLPYNNCYVFMCETWCESCSGCQTSHGNIIVAKTPNNCCGSWNVCCSFTNSRSYYYDGPISRIGNCYIMVASDAVCQYLYLKYSADGFNWSCSSYTGICVSNHILNCTYRLATVDGNLSVGCAGGCYYISIPISLRASTSVCGTLICSCEGCTQIVSLGNSLSSPCSSILSCMRINCSDSCCAGGRIMPTPCGTFHMLGCNCIKLVTCLACTQGICNWTNCPSGQCIRCNEVNTMNQSSAILYFPSSGNYYVRAGNSTVCLYKTTNPLSSWTSVCGIASNYPAIR